MEISTNRECHHCNQWNSPLQPPMTSQLLTALQTSYNSTADQKKQEMGLRVALGRMHLSFVPTEIINHQCSRCSTLGLVTTVSQIVPCSYHTHSIKSSVNGSWCRKRNYIRDCRQGKCAIGNRSGWRKEKSHLRRCTTHTGPEIKFKGPSWVNEPPVEQPVPPTEDGDQPLMNSATLSDLEWMK